MKVRPMVKSAGFLFLLTCIAFFAALPSLKSAIIKAFEEAESSTLQGFLKGKTDNYKGFDSAGTDIGP